MREVGQSFFAPLAWVHGAWARDVLLSVGSEGLWQSIEVNTSAEQRRNATALKGPVIPGMVNAHSHAFQRAIAGMTERTEAAQTSIQTGGQDNFWSWRDRMYSAALRISPAQIEAIAAQLYSELVCSGYTQVCEFHYLHNDPHGKAYVDPLEMSAALARAARKVGIGITLLPTLYMRSGFAANNLRDDQRRFASTPDRIATLVEGIQKNFGDALVNTGLALHSLRAVAPDALREAAQFAKVRQMPIHIHVAEQTSEVADCIQHAGLRPVQWLLEHAGLDATWNLVHATHTTPEELQAVQKSGASIVLCPTTEANLGDGVFDLPSYAKAGGKWSIGSDSHITRSWQEELRLLEYSQRFTLRQRNVLGNATAAHAIESSTAAALFNAAIDGGSAACGRRMKGIAVGERADFSVMDMSSAALLGIPSSHLLDAFIFSSPDARLSDVFVAGKQIVESGCLQGCEALARDFSNAMQHLWA